jgi:hypothetical protein
VPSRPLAPAELVAAARARGPAAACRHGGQGRPRAAAWLAPTRSRRSSPTRTRGLEIALAGELRAEELPVVRATGADIAGVRSAACRDGRRTAPIDPARIARLRAVCAAVAR